MNPVSSAAISRLLSTPASPSPLEALAQAAREDLAALSYPDRPWLAPRTGPDGRPVEDVLIVGGGQSGVIIAAQLKREGLERVAVLDQAAPGLEGPWRNFARMRELRTPKIIVGSEFGIPNLSVRRWYETRHGVEAWAKLERIPRLEWKAYLDWYADAVGVRIENLTQVVDIAEAGDLLRVETLVDGRPVTRHARAAVIATGFDGAGEWRAPAFVADALPPSLYDHSNTQIDLAKLRGKRIGVLGHGASAFDTSVAALQAGAASAEVSFRREKLPRVNPHRAIETAGLMTHFPALADATRWRVTRFFRLNDQPPPVTAFKLAMAEPGFRLRPATPWLSVRPEGDGVLVATPKGNLRYDHLILATGAVVDLKARPELKSLADAVVLWRDRYTPEPGEAHEALSALPYLDEGYAFMPSTPAQGWVSRVFAFNGLSAVSHGPHSTSISCQRYAIPRLVRGVLRQLLRDNEANVLPDLLAYRSQDLPVPDDFEQAYLDQGAPA